MCHNAAIRFISFKNILNYYYTSLSLPSKRDVVMAADMMSDGAKLSRKIMYRKNVKSLFVLHFVGGKLPPRYLGCISLQLPVLVVLGP